MASQGHQQAAQLLSQVRASPNQNEKRLNVLNIVGKLLANPEFHLLPVDVLLGCQKAYNGVLMPQLCALLKQLRHVTNAPEKFLVAIASHLNVVLHELMGHKQVSTHRPNLKKVVEIGDHIFETLLNFHMTQAADLGTDDMDDLMASQEQLRNLQFQLINSR